MPFDMDDLRGRGFVGFLPVARLGRPVPLELPATSGNYIVLRSSRDPPRCSSANEGGRWKRRNPTVPVERLRQEWVDGTTTLYIGRAASLRERVGELLRFSDGDASARHWGGRLLWQLAVPRELLLCWREDQDFARVETALLDEFVQRFGRLPFANLKRGDRGP